MPCPLDPSAPGVSKQMMLDWMHIHHPKTPIRPRIDPVGLAQLVRSVQPDRMSFGSKQNLYTTQTLENWSSFLLPDILCNNIEFPDAADDAPACPTGGTLSIDAHISTKDEPTATTIKICSSTATSQYSKPDSIQDPQNLKILKPPTPPFFKSNTAGRQGKRAASSEVKQSPNSTELGRYNCVSLIFKSLVSNVVFMSIFWRFGCLWYKFKDFEKEESEY